MKNRNDFYKDFVFMVKKHITALRDKQEEINDIDAKMEFGIYDNTKLSNDKVLRKRELSDLKEQCYKEVETLCGDYVRELEKADTVKGAELTEDVNLLNSSIKLSENDIQAMLERNSGNNTMQKVIYQYAKDNNIKAGVYLSPYQASIQAVNNLPYTAKVVERWFDKPNVYDELLGNDSVTAKLFSGE